jgi:hypothetical protein
MNVEEIIRNLPEEKRPQQDDKVFRLTRAQAGFIRSESRYPAYVGSWGTGKSTALIAKAVMLSERYPNNLGVVFRKEFTDLRDSTLKDFESYTGMKVNSERTATFANGSQILFRHMEEMANIQNMNLGWFGIEQAEELDSDEQFFKLHGRLRREGTSRTGFVIANTNGHNWIYKLWKIGKDADYQLFESNSLECVGYLPADTIESWMKLKDRKPKIFNRFVMNSWEESDTTDVIISPGWVSSAVGRRIPLKAPVRRIVSVDVSRFGDDMTVCYAIENGVVLGMDQWEKKSTMETVGKAQLFSKKHGDIQWFAVDEIGVGGGVADRLQELGKKVVMVNSSRRDISGKDRFYNLRAEIYQHGADELEAGRVSLRGDDTDLIEQLSWAKYKTIKSSGVYQVEAKDDIKERYGRSPDNADAFLNGLWALQMVTPEKKHDLWKPERPSYAFNPMTV